MSGEAARAADVRAENEAMEREGLIEELEAAISGAFDHHSQEGTTFQGRQRCKCGHVEPYGLSLGDHQLRMAAVALLPLVQDAR